MPTDEDQLDRHQSRREMLGLTIDPAWVPSVRANLEVSLRLGKLVEDFPLPDDHEPASTFKA